MCWKGFANTGKKVYRIQDKCGCKGNVRTDDGVSDPVCDERTSE